jgi:hypothetical protein
MLVLGVELFFGFFQLVSEWIRSCFDSHLECVQLPPLLWSKPLIFPVHYMYLMGVLMHIGKVRMRTHLRGLNDNVWIICKKGWSRPEGEYENWHNDDVAKSNWNNRVLVSFLIVFPRIGFVEPLPVKIQGCLGYS